MASIENGCVRRRLTYAWLAIRWRPTRPSSRARARGGSSTSRFGWRGAAAGGLGLAPSGEIGDRHALFQPTHGTAPQLAGKNVANPLAMILSAAMMLEWLGDRHDDAAARQAAARIERGVARVLADGKPLTADVGGSATTTDVTNAVLAAVDCGSAL